jgi:hypothetical protein
MKKITFLLFAFLFLLQISTFAQFNVNISNVPTANVTITNAGTVRTFTANAATANVAIADVIAAYTGGGVTEVRILTGATGGTQDGNIVLINGIDYNGIGLGKTLTITANNTINIAQNITDGTAGGDLLNLNFTGNGLGTVIATTVAGVRLNATIQTNGGNLTVTGTQNDAGAKGIYVEGGTITTSGGFVLMTAVSNGINQLPPNTTDGIDYQAITNTNGGAITISGTSTNAAGNNGVQLDALLNSGTGAITLTGVSNGNAVGVVNTLGAITTTSGNVTITGTANNNGLLTTFAGGVVITQAIATGTGKITIVAENNSGIAPAFSNPAVGLGTLTSTSGDISITGTAKNTLAAVATANGVLIEKAINSGTGKITITGENNGTANAVQVANTLTTVGGAITINGTAKNTTGGIGVNITQPISSGAGKITITGESNGNATSNGIRINTNIATTTGNIEMIGVVKGTGGDGRGVELFGTMTTGSGNIIINGESANTFPGASIRNTITSTSGNIDIKGVNKNTTTAASFAYGIEIGSPVSTGGTGKITLTGESNTNEIATRIVGTLTTTGGDITINGTAKNTTGGTGVFIDQAINAGTGKINITGESNGNASAVQVSNTLTTTGGDITLTANAKSTAAFGQAALQIDNNISSGAGKITATGTSNGNNEGIKLGNASLISSTSGEITMIGNALSNTVGNTNAQSLDIESTITSTSGKITLTGTNNANAVAVYLQTVGNINSTSGDIIINATANSTSGGRGFRMRGNMTNTSGKTQITATNNANTEALFIEGGTFTIGSDITLSGTAKNTTGGLGVFLQRPINAGIGKITIIGESNGNANAVQIQNTLTTTTGDITINGTAKNTTGGVGVFINQAINTGTGKITITGENNGLVACVLVNNTINTTTGDITITGLSKNTGGVINAAIDVFANITTTTGKINLTGESNGTNVGIFTGGGTIISTSGGDITLNGKNNQATGGGQGVRVDGTLNPNSGKVNIIGVSNGNFSAITLNTPLTTTGGDITINGTAKNTTGSVAIGVSILQLINSGTGKITITGESNGNASAVAIQNALTTTTGNIAITGTVKATTGNGRGIEIVGTILTGGGSVTLNGESASLFPAVAVFNTITTNGGGVTLNGKATNASNNPTIDFPIGVEIQQPISTGAGKITITGENNGGVPPVLIWVNGNLTTTSGNVEITGKAKSVVGIGRGIDIRNPIITTSGNVTITGESASEYPGTSLFSNITSTSGSFFLKGINNNVTTNSDVPYGIETSGIISTGGGGTISIEGENNANARAIIIFPASTISTVNGNLSIKGVAKSTNNAHVNAIGVDVQGLVNVTGAGNINVDGESNANSLALAVFAPTRPPLSTNTGNINLNGLSKSTVGTLSVAVQILSIIQSNAGKISIIGESHGFANAINSAFSLVNQKDISLISRRGNISFNSFIQSTNGGAIDICLAPGNSLVVANAIGGNSIQTTGGATITISHGGSALAVGNPTNLTGLISNGVNTVPAGTYTGANFGAIAIKNSLGFQTVVPSLLTTNLNGYVFGLTIEGCLAGASWANPLTPANFGLVNFPTGTSIRTVNRLSDTEVSITLNFTGDDLDLDFPNAQLIARSTAFGTGLGASFATPIRGFIPTPILSGIAGSQSVRLTWDTNVGITNYTIYGYALGQPQQLIGSTSDNNFTVTGLKNATTYYFRIIATTKNGFTTPFSNLIELRPSIILGTEDESLNNLLNVYPNPSEGTFTLTLEEKKIGKGSLQIFIYDLAGKIQYQESQSKFKGVYQKAFDEKNLPSGMYLIQIQTEQGVYSKKIIIK